MKVGDKINGLTMIGERFVKEDKRGWALFRCECGNEKEIRIDRVKNGNTKYCGCHVGKGGKGNYKYGICHTRIYKIWEKMKQRCTNPNYKEFYLYGGRGIKICDEWQDPKAFYDWSIANGYKDGLSIDRVDTNKNYEPSNCRWATAKEQANNRRNNINITLHGKTKTLSQWCEELNQPYPRIQARLSRGWSFERALSK